MRRGACLLALLGMTVQTAVGEEFFNGNVARPRPTSAATSPATATPGKAPVAPQKFTRTATASPSAQQAPQQSNDELRNYYKELFGSEPAAAPASPLEGRSTLTAKPVSPVVQPIPAAKTGAGPAVSALPAGTAPDAAARTMLNAAQDGSRVLHAEFRDTTAPGEQKIQQLSADGVNARPFPGAPAQAPAKTAATESFHFDAAAAAPVEKEARGFAPASMNSFAAGMAPAADPAATVPVSVTPAGVSPAAGTVAPAEITQASATSTTPRGSISFSRSNPGVPARSTVGNGRQAALPTARQEQVVSSITTSPAVSIEWRKQTDLSVGQECVCHLIVKNEGQTAAKEMEVRAFFPESVRLVGAKPTPASSDRFLGWQIDELKAGEERTIEITMVPLQQGSVNTRADVRFSGTANGSFAVSEPMLDLRVEGPQQVLIGESAAQIVTVSNPGTGIATHVQIEAMIPEGLEHIRGQRLQMDLGNLNPGESRSVRLALAAAKGGPQQLSVQARAESGLVRSATSDVMVIAPSLTASIQGPGLRYLGRQASFVMSVSNDGAAATDNVQLRYKMPSGFDFVSADRGAQYDPATGLVNCFVGRLEKGQKSEIKVTLLARQSGEFKHLARATSEHGAVSDAEFTTTVEATSSLAVQIKDLEDPVEVGSETAYEIRVKNEGTAAAKGVVLKCEMADGMKITSAEGPSEFLSEGNSVVFRPLAEVGAGQSVVFKVKVKSATAGSLRFRAHLSSESVSEPLTAEEMTKFYGE